MKVTFPFPTSEYPILQGARLLWYRVGEAEPFHTVNYPRDFVVSPALNTFQLNVAASNRPPGLDTTQQLEVAVRVYNLTSEKTSPRSAPFFDVAELSVPGVPVVTEPGI